MSRKPFTNVTSKMPGILSLPHELLCVTVAELPLVDLLEARAACRALYKACSTLQVWRQLLNRSLGVTLPKPFFLPHPLSHCSQKDLERAIRRWDAPWLPTGAIQTIRRKLVIASRDECRFRANSVVMAPGGRYALLCRRDSSVWYLDLSNDWASTTPLEPCLLVPAMERLPTDTSGWNFVRVTLAVDWTSEEALGSSKTSHVLTRFNIAVFAQVSDVQPMRIDVWNVQVSDGSKGGLLRLGEHLSSFAAGPVYDGVTEARLYGTALAYRVYDHRAFVVDWREVNGKRIDDALPGRCVVTGHGERRSHIYLMHLLPGNRVLIASRSTDNDIFTLHNWERDYPLLSDISRSHDIDCNSTSCSWNPVWQFASPHRLAGIQFTRQPPCIMKDTVRMVLPTSKAVYGLAIALDDHTEGGVQLTPLIEAEFGRLGYSTYSQTFHLNRAVGMRLELIRRRGKREWWNSGVVWYAQYSWDSNDLERGERGSELQPEPDSTSDFAAQFHSIPLPPLLTRKSSDPAVCFFDPFSNRVVVVNHKCSRVYTLFPTEVTDSEGGVEESLCGEVEKEEEEEGMEPGPIEWDVFGGDTSEERSDDESAQVASLPSKSPKAISAPTTLQGEGRLSGAEVVPVPAGPEDATATPERGPLTGVSTEERCCENDGSESIKCMHSSVGESLEGDLGAGVRDDESAETCTSNGPTYSGDENSCVC